MKSLTCILAGAFIGRALAQSSAWGQCGGTGWTGATACVSGYTCTYSTIYYSQCLPGTAATTLTTSTTSKASSSTSAVVTSALATTTGSAGTGFKWLGVDESGAEFGTGIYPGTWGKDFTFPADSSLQV